MSKSVACSMKMVRLAAMIAVLFASVRNSRFLWLSNYWQLWMRNIYSQVSNNQLIHASAKTSLIYFWCGPNMWDNYLFRKVLLLITSPQLCQPTNLVFDDQIKQTKHTKTKHSFVASYRIGYRMFALGLERLQQTRIVHKACHI